MHDEMKLYKNSSELIDERCFQIGEIYFIKDELVSIPDADRVENGRDIHEGRRVVIIHNHEQNNNKLCPIVTIAPFSHRIDLKRPHDLIVTLEDVEGGLKVDSLIRLSLMQPVLKIDMERCIGSLKDYKVEELIAMQIEMLGIE
ncbi:MAG: type II toxin-antitoxin system PemK/MazF family toxin [Bacillota bacterium]|nr:type II toxin-antitoxin system PemK/MazF family toxin [Bacillota bacterium]